MNPDIFNVHFERTEFSDELHGILGRALIVVTRFDSMCEAVSTFLRVKSGLIRGVVSSEVEYQDFISQIVDKSFTLNKNIKMLNLPANISDILHSARIARNFVAHELARGLAGCLDSNINEEGLVREVSSLVEKIAYGEIVISTLISLLNDDPLPNNQLTNEYAEKIINWVVER